MLPPPDASYPSSTALMEAVRDFACTQGYAVSILRSDNSKVVIKCKRGSVYRRRAAADQEPVRKCASRLIGCPFRAKGRLQKNGTWKLRTITSEHNHSASTDMGGHPTARRLQPEQKVLTHQMLRAGVAPRVILTSLRQIEPSNLAIGRTIYKQRKQLRQEEHELIVDLFLAAVRQRYLMVGPHQQAQILEQLQGIAVENPMPMPNPAPVEHTRGRPRGSISQKAFVNNTSTQRDPSQFKIVQPHSGPRKRRCGNCQGIGHNVRTCPQRIVYSSENSPTTT